MKEIFGKFNFSSISFIVDLRCIGYTFIKKIEDLKEIRISLKSFKKIVLFDLSSLSYVHDRKNMPDLLIHFS